MTIAVFGAGLGRTGTFSLRLALQRLGFGPCHHMTAVADNLPSQVPLWSAALDGRPDWETLYQGFLSAVDWPTAAFYAELADTFPNARFILTVREPGAWAESYSKTIQRLLLAGKLAPRKVQPWIRMVENLVARNGFPGDLSREALRAAFISHNEAVTRTIPKERLLKYDVREGWAPLCAFLDVPVPTMGFPHRNGRAEFWGRVGANLIRLG